MAKRIDRLVKEAKNPHFQAFLEDFSKIRGLIKVWEIKKSAEGKLIPVKVVIHSRFKVFELSLKINYSARNIISLQEVKKWQVCSTDPKDYIYRPDGKLLYKINPHTFYNLEEDILYERNDSSTLEVILGDKKASEEQRRIRIKGWLLGLHGPEFKEFRGKGLKLLEGKVKKKR